MTLRQRQIRAQAAELRARYAAESGAPAPDPLPLDDLAERLFLISVFDDPALDPRISGELNPAVGSIRLRPGLPPALRRFVVAHELGHAVLEGLTDAVYLDDDTTIDECAGADLDGEAGVLRAYNTRERREQEANLFAIELLLPAEKLQRALLRPGWTIAELAESFGVSPSALRTQLVQICRLDPPEPARRSAAAPQAFAPDADQQRAVDAPLPMLLVAGPGSGKTRTIVARYVALAAQGVDPAHILALTFSNKAAEELRERIVAALDAWRADLAARVEVTTFHAWGLNALRQYGPSIGLPPDLRVCSSGDVYVLLRRRIDELPLEQYKDLRDPGAYLAQIVGAISRAKDELCDPPAFAALAEAEAARLLEQAAAPIAKATKAARQARDKAARDAARLRELAAIYPRYEAILRDEGALDYGDLVMRAVEALRVPEVARALQAQHHYILIDEFQDINYASGELARLLDGGRGRVWAVGDPWQSIYRFRGASPANLQQFAQVYPAAATRDLHLNYRSAQPILDAAHALMAPDPLAATRGGLTAWRGAASGRAVVEWALDDADEAGAQIAHDILRRVRARRLPPCARMRPRLRGRAARPALRRMWPPIRPRFADHAILCRTRAQAAQISAALQAHGVPVDQAGELFDAPEVKDALAILGLAAQSAPALLRALTIPAFALDAADLAMLIEHADEARQTVAEAARDPALVQRMSAAGQQALRELHALADEVAAQGDAWQALAHYLFERSAAVRSQIADAARGDFSARRALSALGQLVLMARSFVRQSPTASGPAEFVAYVRRLIEAGESVPAVVPAAQADVVRVLTAHAAKGLEFPIVYIPGLNEGGFPPRKQYGSIPALPALVHGSPAEDQQDERYLLYVAMTRARDRLLLCRARARGAHPMRRSSLLPGGPDGAGAPWPVVRRRAVRGCPSPAPEARILSAPLRLATIPAAGLETYERCPRQYFYQYGCRLGDEGSPYLRMHQALRAAVEDLAQHARQNALPQDEQALRALIAGASVGRAPADPLYRDDYLDITMQSITALWRDLRDAGSAPDLNRRHVLRRPAGAVAVRVDREEPGDAGPRWVRLRAGRPRDDDHLSMQVMLYALAYRQEHGAPGEIALHYSSTGERRAATPAPDLLESRATQIDRLLEGIRDGEWSPRPGRQCATCPFNLLCPA